MEKNDLINYYQQQVEKLEDKVKELEDKYDKLEDFTNSLDFVAFSIALNYELLKKHTIFKNISVKDFCKRFYEITNNNLSVNTFYKILRDEGVLKKRKWQINQPRVGFEWWFDTATPSFDYKYADSIRVITDEGQRGIFKILCSHFGYSYFDYFDINFDAKTYLKEFIDKYDTREI